MQTKKKKTKKRPAPGLLYVNEPLKPYLKDRHRYLVLYGGAGSGKSVFAAQKVLATMVNQAGAVVVLIRKVAKTIRSSMYTQIKLVARGLDIEHHLSFYDGDQRITCSNGSVVISMGMDDREKVKSLAQPCLIWVEEATELDREDFQQLDLRLRGDHAEVLQMILSFNPVNKGHWIYKRFFLKPDPKAVLVHSTFRSNMRLDDNYREVLEALRLQDEQYFKVYALGEWGDMRQGMIFNYSQVDEIPECDEVIYGLDFGFNNPTALVEVNIRENKLFVRELLYEQHLVNSELVSILKMALRKPTAEVYADAAEPARIEELYRAGINVHKALKQVQDGIDRVKRFKLHVLRGSINLIQELDNYTWKLDRLGNQLDEPEKLNDHACDALRYAVHTHFGRPRQVNYGFV